MSDKAIETLLLYISSTTLGAIDHWIAKYPEDQRQSAVMGALTVIQEELGYLSPEVMSALAHYLNMSEIAVFEVANFYTMYERQPIGRHLIGVCTNISCKLRNSAGIVDHLERTLKIKVGETTKDKRFTFRTVECLGACVKAPMMQIGTEYHEYLTPESVDDILKNYE